jgi:3-phenylpropionate/cinnamic acid dioxygenase small subunit
MDCRDLVYDFAHHIDNGRYDQVAALFTKDCRIDGPNGIYEGRAALLANLQRRAADRFTRHLCTNVRIRAVDDRRAEGVSTVLFFLTKGLPEAAPLPMVEPEAVASWEDEFELTDDGWRIAARKTVFMLK